MHFSQTATFGYFGDVVSDWATYFTMNGNVQRGWIWKAYNYRNIPSGTSAALELSKNNNSNTSASLSTRGVFSAHALARSEDSFIIAPSGGYFNDTTNSRTGAIKITLPQSWTSTMMDFWVDIYNYSDMNMVSYHIGGYNYSTTPAWVNCSAYSVGQGNHADLTVRFGHDGTKCCITIGEIDTTWSYPKVTIRDVTVGHSYNNINRWGYGWTISFVTTLPTTVNVTKTNTATVKDGTVPRMVYYDTVNHLKDTPNMIYLANVDSSGQTTIGKINGIKIYGNTYGNTAANLISNTVGVFSIGDPGP
mgnify:CR=1 FL=1